MNFKHEVVEYQNVLQNISGVSISDTHTQSSTVDYVGMIDPIDAVIGAGSGFLSVSVLITIAAVTIKKTWLKPKLKPVRFSFKDHTGDFVEESENLNELIQKHYALGNNKVAAQLNAVMKETRELFQRIKEHGSDSKMIETSVKYADIFKKLNIIFGEKVYLDVRKNPHYYDEPEKLIKDSENILKVVHKQVLENIKQVNKNGDLDFKVAMEALIGKNDSNLEHVFQYNEDNVVKNMKNS